MPQVFMPRLSDTMTEGTVSTWTKGVGDRIEKGDVIAEIETDKATMELEAYDAGVLEQILVDVGKTVPIGEVIAVIGDGSGAATAPAAASTAPVAESTTPAAESTAPAAASAAPAPSPAAEPAAVAPAAAAASAPTATPPASNGKHPLASPLARNIARDAGLDLATVAGSGPGGRIVRADVEHAIATLGTPAAASTPAPVAPAAAVALSAAPAVEVQTGPD